MTAQGLSPFDWLSNSEIGAEDAMRLNEEAAQRATEARLEFAKLCFDVFEANPRGILLMEKLDALTIRMPLMQVTGSLVSGEVNLSPADWAYIRAGQNSVIHFLLANIEFAKNPPTTATKGTEEDGQ